LDHNKFTPRWNWSNPTANVNTGNNVLSRLVTGSGKAVIASTGFATQSNQTYIYALNEATGVIDWQYNFGVLSRVNDPSVTDGRVFVASSGHSDTFMWSFDVNTGALKYKTAFESQWDRYLAPAIKNGYIYTNGGYFGGMNRFKEATGKLNWFASLEQYDGWSPAVDDNYAYAYTGDKLHAVNLTTGMTEFTIPNNGSTATFGATPVLLGDGTALVVDAKSSAYSVFSFHLIRYDLNTRTELWRAPGSFASDPVVAAGAVYVLNTQSNALEAYRLSDGALLWSWSPSDTNEKVSVGFNLIVTNNLLFVSSANATYAIDLATHQPVWSNSHTGGLSLSSNKVLYITSDREVQAVSVD
jgi:outer membrane protein assembly factor BamB